MYYPIYDTITGKLVAIGVTGSNYQMPLNELLEDYRKFIAWYAEQDPKPFNLSPEE